MALAEREEIREVERRKRRREGILILLSLVLLAVMIVVEVRVTRPIAGVPRDNNILVFGLINVIILLSILIVYLTSRNVAKLLAERRANLPGARLRTRLVLAFAGLSLVPTMLLFLVSAGFITKTIQNWFNQQVELSLNESMEVAQTYYKTSAANALYYGNQISARIREQKLLNEENLPRLRDLVHQKQAEYNLGVVEVYSAQREELVRAANPQLPRTEFSNPSSEDIREGLAGKEITRINPVGKADLIRGIVPVRSTWNPQDVVAVVVVNYYVPYSLVSKMKEISSSYHEFHKLKIMKAPITTAYILILFLITLVILMLAVGFGLHLAKSLTIPLLELASATRQIAEGNLDVHLGQWGDDEIGMLVASFNTMTDDLRRHQLALKQTNDEVVRSNQELEERRRYMETVLKNVTAGVISVDRAGILTTVNKSAERLLGIDAREVLGKNFREVLRSVHLDIVKGMLRDMVVAKQDSIRKQVTIPLKDTQLTLMMNLTVLKDERDEFLGTVVVFDDLTQLIKAQRMAAWREVARRIAHEIKNPLTPIQLSAQRLRKRYLDRFDADDRVFDQCTAMIITSVDEMKTLVDEFSSFARMPAAQPVPSSLAEIVQEALALYRESHRAISFSFRADGDLPLLPLDRDQIKRVFINLLDNAVAAIDGEGSVELDVSYNRELNMAVCVVADSGCGIPAEHKPRLFEPYFSTKKAGTGLGLAIVNTIVTDHHGFIRVRDNVPRGTRFVIELPVGGTEV